MFNEHLLFERELDRINTEHEKLIILHERRVNEIRLYTESSLFIENGNDEQIKQRLLDVELEQFNEKTDNIITQFFSWLKSLFDKLFGNSDKIDDQLAAIEKENPNAKLKLGVDIGGVMDLVGKGGKIIKDVMSTPEGQAVAIVGGTLASASALSATADGLKKDKKTKEVPVSEVRSNYKKMKTGFGKQQKELSAYEQTLKNASDEYKTQRVGFFRKVLGGMGSAVSAAGGAISEAIGNAGYAVGDAASAVTNAVISLPETVPALIKKQAPALKATFKKDMETIIDTAKISGKMTKDQTKQLIDTSNANIKKFITSAVEETKNNAKKAKITGDEMAQAIDKTITKAAKAFRDDVIDPVLGAAAVQADNLGAFYNDAIESVKDDLRDANKALYKTGENIKKGAKKIADDANVASYKAATATADAVKKGTDAMKDKITTGEKKESSTYDDIDFDIEELITEASLPTKDVFNNKYHNNKVSPKYTQVYEDIMKRYKELDKLDSVINAAKKNKNISDKEKAAIDKKIKEREILERRIPNDIYRLDIMLDDYSSKPDKKLAAGVQALAKGKKAATDKLKKIGNRILESVDEGTESELLEYQSLSHTVYMLNAYMENADSFKVASFFNENTVDEIVEKHKSVKSFIDGKYILEASYDAVEGKLQTINSKIEAKTRTLDKNYSKENHRDLMKELHDATRVYRNIEKDFLPGQDNDVKNKVKALYKEILKTADKAKVVLRKKPDEKSNITEAYIDVSIDSTEISISSLINLMEYSRYEMNLLFEDDDTILEAKNEVHRKTGANVIYNDEYNINYDQGTDDTHSNLNKKGKQLQKQMNDKVSHIKIDEVKKKYQSEVNTIYNVIIEDLHAMNINKKTNNKSAYQSKEKDVENNIKKLDEVVRLANRKVPEKIRDKFKDIQNKIKTKFEQAKKFASFTITSAKEDKSKEDTVKKESSVSFDEDTLMEEIIYENTIRSFNELSNLTDIF